MKPQPPRTHGLGFCEWCLDLAWRDGKTIKRLRRYHAYNPCEKRIMTLWCCPDCAKWWRRHFGKDTIHRDGKLGCGCAEL